MGLVDPKSEKLATLIGSGTEPMKAWTRVMKNQRAREYKAWAAKPEHRERVRQIQEEYVRQALVNRNALLAMGAEIVQETLALARDEDHSITARNALYRSALSGLELLGRTDETGRVFTSKALPSPEDPFEHLDDNAIRSLAARIRRRIGGVSAEDAEVDAPQ